MNRPLRFTPIIKRAAWGGRRLETVLGKSIGPGEDYAETWEVADHGQDQSTVAGGELNGWTLARLVRDRNHALLGRHAGASQFPLLVKYLDARKTLSVQVHPDDATAARYDPTEKGKAEAWVILSADPGSRLYAGLAAHVDEATLRTALASGDITDCLHSIEVHPGDCIFNPAGAVHAIGAGIVLAEVQQSSDITFRLFDWKRLGLDGKPRPLHIEEAMGCIDFDLGPLEPVSPVDLGASHRHEELVRCEYFVIQRHTSDSAFMLEKDDRFVILMMLKGEASLSCGGNTVDLRLGDTLVLPAQTGHAAVAPRGECTLLASFVP